MGVLSNGRKISEQFFLEHALIQMLYNKTFGCIIVKKVFRQHSYS